jgi:hypothetical protein
MEKKKFTLQDIDKKQVFQVPDAYFEQLPSAIGDKITSAGQRRNVYLGNWLKYSISLATVCLLLALGYFWFSPGSSNGQIMADVSNQEIVEYLQQTDVSTYDLMEAASVANVSMQDSLPGGTTIDTELILDEAESATLEELI